MKRQRCMKVQRHGWKWENEAGNYQTGALDPKTWFPLSYFYCMLRLLKEENHQVRCSDFFFFSLTTELWNKLLKSTLASYCAGSGYSLEHSDIFLPTVVWQEGKAARRAEIQKSQGRNEGKRSVCDVLTELKLEVRQPPGQKMLQRGYRVIIIVEGHVFTQRFTVTSGAKASLTFCGGRWRIEGKVGREQAMFLEV